MAKERKKKVTENPSEVVPEKKKTRIGFIFVSILVLIVVVGFLGRWSMRSYCKSLAKDRMAKFEYTQALAALDFTETWKIDDFEVHFLKARIFRKTGKFDNFDESLAKARTLGLPESTLENEKLLLGGQSGQIAELLSQLEDLAGGVEQFDPAEVYEALVNGFLLHGRFTEASEYVENWKKDFPGDPTQRFYEAVLLIRFGPVQKIEGAQEKAATILDKLVTEFPSYYRARMAYGDLLFDLNQIENSAIQFEKCLNNVDAGIQPRLSLARCYANLGRTDEAKQMFEQVLEENNENDFARGELGKLQLADEEFEVALKNLQQAYPNRDWDFDLNNNLGQALQANGRAEDAKKYFDRADEIREKLAIIQKLMDEVDLFRDEDKRFELAKLMLEYGNPEQGLLYMRSVLDVNPRHVGANQAMREHLLKKTKQNPRLNLFETPIKQPEKSN